MDKRSKPIPDAWRAPINDWLESLAASGLSEQTIRLRRAHVAKLSRAVGCSPNRLSASDLRKYLASGSWAAETRRAIHASFKSFFMFIGRCELTESLPRVKPAAPAPRPAPTDAYRQALHGADKRVYLMLRLAAELGLRRGEIARLHIDDIGRDLLGEALSVHGKGNKIRCLPCSSELAALMRSAAGANGFIFPGSDTGHLSPNWVGKLIAAALPGKWTAHTLRHRFATRAYDSSDDLLAVSRLLGHASVATTQRYIATDAARLRQVMSLAA